MKEKSTTEVYVGIDVSKGRLDVFDGEARQFSNDGTGIKKLVLRLKKRCPKLIVLESTGGYECELMAALWDAKLPFSRVNPSKTKAYSKSCGRRAKTDKIDAEMLQSFAEKMNPEPTPQPASHTTLLRPLFDRYRQLIDMRTAEKNRLNSPSSNSSMKESNTKMIAFINEELKLIEKQVNTAISENPELQSQAEALRSELGVGPTLTLAILADMPEIGTLSRGEVAALVGVAPYNNQSGSKDGKRFIRGGRKNVRSVLYMATLIAMRFNPKLRSYYLRLVKMGKAKKVAVVAAMRRFICVLNSKLRELRLAQENKQPPTEITVQSSCV